MFIPRQQRRKWRRFLSAVTSRSAAVTQSARGDSVSLWRVAGCWFDPGPLHPEGDPEALVG